MLFSIFKKNLKVFFLILIFLPTYIFLAGTSLLDNHFLVFVPLLSILAAIPINYVSAKFNIKYLLLILLIIIIFNLYLVNDILLSKSAVGKLRDFTIDNIDDSSLVIVDSRIYGGRIAWIFNDKHYVEILNIQSNSFFCLFSTFRL